MAITNTWSVSDMQHMDSDGGVFLVYWSMVSSMTALIAPVKAASCVVSMTLQARPISHTLT
jgi:hypothetical protein